MQLILKVNLPWIYLHGHIRLPEIFEFIFLLVPIVHLRTSDLQNSCGGEKPEKTRGLHWCVYSKYSIWDREPRPQVGLWYGEPAPFLGPKPLGFLWI